MSAPQSPSETHVLYNAACPVCTLEMDHYRKRAARDALPLRFDDLNGPDLEEWGITPNEAARRLHVRSNGQILSGLPAFRALWREIPHVRWLATVTGLPVIRPVMDWGYEHVFAPILYRAHLRRVAKREGR